MGSWLPASGQSSRNRLFVIWLISPYGVTSGHGGCISRTCRLHPWPVRRRHTYGRNGSRLSDESRSDITSFVGPGGPPFSQEYPVCAARRPRVPSHPGNLVPCGPPVSSRTQGGPLAYVVGRYAAVLWPSAVAIVSATSLGLIPGDCPPASLNRHSHRTEPSSAT